ncbi:ABC-type transport system involved in resistance to organic solvents, auxiliary component [Opitutaceae bacterium TAV1]|nr:ABC-type transport system involved in resistance to organic solvents, auxiliary component [Opitutaceae bacterium TAV1]
MIRTSRTPFAKRRAIRIGQPFTATRHTMKRHLALLLAIPLLLACSATVRAAVAGNDPQQTLTAAVDQVLSVAYDTASHQPLHQRLRPVLEQYFNFERATRLAIGPGWRSFSADQQKRTIDLFATLVIRTYSDKFDPGPRPVIAFGKAGELSETRREIPSTITFDGKRYAVAYRLEQAKDKNAWRIYDVIIEGVSLVANYRAQFDPLYKKGGADEVIRSLEKNLQQPVVSGQP